MWGILALMALSFAGCGEPTAGPPNLLLVTIDTLRADRLACYGGHASVGTRLCALGDEGTRFVWALSPAPATAPAVASLLTGRLPSQHGVTQIGTSELADGQTTVAEILAEAGYHTGAVVSNPVLLASRRFDQGFGVYDDHMTRRERNRPQLRERAAQETTQAALAFLATATEPWFLWVHYQDPHGPYEPPGSTPPTDLPGHARLPILRNQSGYGGVPGYQALEGSYTASAYERAYTEEISYLERHLGTLLDIVERRYSPFVVVTSDHGEAFGEDDYWFAHGHSLGLDQIRVPLWVRPPGGGTAQVESQPVSTAGVAATLIRAAGLPIPRSIEAPPLSVSAAEAPEAPGPILAEHRARLAVVLGDRYYARDRSGFSTGGRDPISGGVVWALPPRTAQLGTDGSATAYVEGRPDTLEAALGAHEESAEVPPSIDRTDGIAPLPDSQRRALEALGYLE